MKKALGMILGIVVAISILNGLIGCSDVQNDNDYYNDEQSREICAEFTLGQ